MVERSPEKAGVGGSIPSLATTLSCFEISPLRSPLEASALRPPERLVRLNAHAIVDDIDR